MSHYEVVYYYHERLPNGKWNMEERLETKKKVGSPVGEVELEKLAAIILGQLAKRDKLVVDVEVYEYSKRKINYKEATDGTGIVLKNKKFNTSSMAGELVEEEVAEETDPEITHHGSRTIGKVLTPLPRNEDATRASNRNRVLTWMVFDPEVHNLHEAKANGLRLTVGKKYPIYQMEDSPTGIGQVITLVDDVGKQQLVSDKYFIANTQIRLVGDDEVEGGFSNQPQQRGGPRLSYSGNYDAPMPNLRPSTRSM